jgi:hypothetical protein
MINNLRIQNGQFGQYGIFQIQGTAPGFGFGAELFVFSSLKNMNKPLNERPRYVINAINCLLNKHHIGKFLEEKIVLKIFYSSFFKLVFLY